MSRRDESVALRALVAAVESNTESIRVLGTKLDQGFEMVDTKLDAVMGALTDHVTTMHGEES
jgi:hypothetical protein